jgi:hypothetical protein
MEMKTTIGQNRKGKEPEQVKKIWILKMTTWR